MPPATERPCPRACRRAGRLGTALLSAAVLAVAAAAVQGQAGPRAWTELSPPQPMAGEPFRVLLHVRGIGLDAIRVLEPRLPAGVEWAGGPELLPPADGAAHPPARVIAYTLRARRTGRYLLDGFLVRLTARSLYTRATELEVVEAAAAPPARPAVAWIPGRRRAVAGETVSVQLVLLQAPALQLPDRIEVRPPRDSRFERYRGEVAISEQMSGGRRVYRVPLAAYLLTPTAAGTVTLPAARVTLPAAEGPLVLQSEAMTLEVTAAPPDIAATGAVGTLRVRSWIDERRLPEGLEVTANVTVTGTGNHRFIEPPEPRAAGMTLVDRTVHQDLTLHDAGYRGRIHGVYRYHVTRPGTYSIQVPEFAYYDTGRATVVRVPGRAHVVRFRGAQAAAAAGAGGGPGRALAPPPPGWIMRRGCVPPWRFWPHYLLLLPGGLLAAAALRTGPRGAGGERGPGRALPLAGALAVAAAGSGVTAALPAVTLEPREQAQAALAHAAQAYQREDYAAAGAAFAAVQRRFDCFAGVSYNRALAERALGDDAAAIAAVRAAVRAAPLTGAYRNLLGELESAAGLDTQHRPPPFLPPALPFYGLLAVANGAGLAAWIAARNPAGRARVKGTLWLGAAGGACMALLLAGATLDRSRELVVARATELRRIPVVAALPWVPLTPGSTLEVRGAHRDHLLVRTAYGLDAWVDRAAVVEINARDR